MSVRPSIRPSVPYDLGNHPDPVNLSTGPVVVLGYFLGGWDTHLFAKILRSIRTFFRLGGNRCNYTSLGKASRG